MRGLGVTEKGNGLRIQGLLTTEECRSSNGRAALLAEVMLTENYHPTQAYTERLRKELGRKYRGVRSAYLSYLTETTQRVS
jgi:hypothetical protein